MKIVKILIIIMGLTPVFASACTTPSGGCSVGDCTINGPGKILSGGSGSWIHYPPDKPDDTFGSGCTCASGSYLVGITPNPDLSHNGCMAYQGNITGTLCERCPMPTNENNSGAYSHGGGNCYVNVGEHHSNTAHGTFPSATYRYDGPYGCNPPGSALYQTAVSYGLIKKCDAGYYLANANDTFCTQIAANSGYYSPAGDTARTQCGGCPSGAEYTWSRTNLAGAASPEDCGLSISNTTGKQDSIGIYEWR